MEDNRSLEQTGWEEDEFDRTVSAFSVSRERDKDFSGQTQREEAASCESEEEDEFDRTVSVFSGGRRAAGGGGDRRGYTQAALGKSAAGKKIKEKTSKGSHAGKKYGGLDRRAVPGRGIGARKPMSLGLKIALAVGGLLLLVIIISLL